MTFKSIKGGADLTPPDDDLVRRQKAITAKINEKFIKVKAVWLKPQSKEPIDAEWTRGEHGDLDMTAWIDNPERQPCNLGFMTNSGWLDIDIDANDPEFNKVVVAALTHVGVDTRLAFGRRSTGCPSHVMVSLPKEESDTFDQLQRFEPKAFKISGERFHVQLRSSPTNSDKKNAVASAAQTVMPGSVYDAKIIGIEYDPAVWYVHDNSIADNVTSIIVTTPREAEYKLVVRGIAFGVIAYFMRGEWTKGSRQDTARILGGWLTRIVNESQALEETTGLKAGVICPINSDEIAASLISFICNYCGDDEKPMRLRTFADARRKIDLNPSNARVPGWGAMLKMLEAQAMEAIKTVLRPGADTSILAQFAEDYLYCKASTMYIDRKSMLDGLNYEFEPGALKTRHASDRVMIGGKSMRAFDIFEGSKLRILVGTTDLLPDWQPGFVYRRGISGRILSDEDESERAHTVFNTWRGWTVLPIDTIDPAMMERAVALLDRLLGYLTCDNEKQIDWIKKWLAWTWQNPGTKQQIGWVCVGGQGVGKSFFGKTLMPKIMGDLAGIVVAKTLGTDFIVGSFKDKMFVFMDEVDLTRDADAAGIIKDLVRSVRVQGAEKFQESRGYSIYARLMFASNKTNTGVVERDVTDRAIFYTRAYDEHFLKMTQPQFRHWTLGLKTFFDDFEAALDNFDFCRHLVRYFMDIKTDRHEIESIEHSSSSDSEVAKANMSWTRRIAQKIVESGWIAANDLAWEMPFNGDQWHERVKFETEKTGMKVSPDKVMAEFETMGLIERVVDGGIRLQRSTLRWQSACEQFTASTNAELTDIYRDFVEGETGENTTTLADKTRRIGSRSHKF
jgi:hypothetical protein